LEQIGDRLIAYRYDQTRVKAGDNQPEGNDSGIVISQDLKVRDEKIGELVVAGLEDVDTGTMEVLSTVSERLSLHLETLRLSEQTQQALTISERQAYSLAMLNEMAGKLTNAGSTLEIFRVSLLQTQRIVGGDQTTIAVPLPESAEGELFTIDKNGSLSPGIRLPQKGTLFGIAMLEKRMVNYPEEISTYQGDLRDLLLMRQEGIKTVLAVPLIASGNVIGVLSVGSNASQFNDNQRSLLAQVVSLMSSALENRILLETVQARARREQNLRQITSAVRSSVDPEYILKTAAKELGTAMNRKVIIRLSSNTPDNGDAV
jgi:transcriptional regulator with GAF, ATPase, and Fis domain